MQYKINLKKKKNQQKKRKKHPKETAAPIP